ncbi:hypothetical protein ACFL6S_35510 [Candidatus Poribacteria bacterium]
MAEIECLLQNIIPAPVTYRLRQSSDVSADGFDDLVAQTIDVDASEPLDEEAKHDIEEETGKRVMVMLAKQLDIEEVLEEYYTDEPLLTERSHERPADGNAGATVNA